jgi:homoserine kinase
MTIVRVTIPATSANLGPGFDCLGLALGLHNVIEMVEIAQGLAIEISGEGGNTLPLDQRNVVVRAANALFDRVGQRPTGLYIAQGNDIPAGSGMGSSAAALVGGLVGANMLIGEPLGRDELLQMAVELEGHPDNVSPAMLGGLVMSSFTEDGFAARRIAMPGMQVAVVLPSVITSTREQRAALPQQVSMKDAVANIGRALLVTEALREADYDLLNRVMKDRLHEPYRRKSIPGFQQVLNAAYEAGAAAVVISGAGPSVIAFGAENHKAIVAAMIQAFRDKGNVSARGWVLPVDSQGVRVTIQAS